MNNLFRKSKNDVYICYDVAEEQVARNVCWDLEGNGMNCRIKFHDFSENDSLSQEMDAISSSSLMVLIYSKNEVNSNFVYSQVDWAFSSGAPICTFKVEDIDIRGGLEFYLKKQPDFISWQSNLSLHSFEVEIHSSFFYSTSFIWSNIFNYI